MAKKKKMNWIDRTAYILLLIGGLNWGLSIFNINLVSYIPTTILQNTIYSAVGLSALYGIYSAIKIF